MKILPQILGQGSPRSDPESGPGAHIWIRTPNPDHIIILGGRMRSLRALVYYTDLTQIEQLRGAKNAYEISVTLCYTEDRHRA